MVGEKFTMSFTNYYRVDNSLKEIFDQTIDQARTLLNESGVDDGHGIDHALKVLDHVEQGLKETDFPSEHKLAIRLAALLHDTDDHKFFPQSKDYDNARTLLKSYPENVQTLAIKMIKLVSCSTNGNSDVEEDWLLYPRWADRLESLGEIGIYRCWLYNKHVDRLMFTEDTPRPTTEEELSQIATRDRFENYIAKRGKVGKSTMIDHYYDKLLHLRLDVPNSYFQREFDHRHQIMVDFVLEFGKTGTIDEQLIQSYK